MFACQLLLSFYLESELVIEMRHFTVYYCIQYGLKLNHLGTRLMHAAVGKTNCISKASYQTWVFAFPLFKYVFFTYYIECVEPFKSVP